MDKRKTAEYWIDKQYHAKLHELMARHCPGTTKCVQSGKTAYKKQGHATVMLEWINAHPSEANIISDYELAVYKCHGHWHLGRKKKDDLQRLLDEIRVLSQVY